MPKPNELRAFTLLELIVSIAVVTVLVLLVAGQLKGIKEASGRARIHADLRSHAGVFAAYNADWADHMPYVTSPNSSYTSLQTGNFSWKVRYFDASVFWNIGLADRYYDGNVLQACFQPPGRAPSADTPYRYSNSFLADHRYWRSTTRVGPSQWKAMKAADVAFPSKKGQLVNWHRAYSGQELVFGDTMMMETGLCDGSVKDVRQNEFLQYVRDGPGPFMPGPAPIGSPVLHTVDGVQGRDIR
jgi:prepilin-type N-terminal cleavage/methylation domain-containing protein